MKVKTNLSTAKFKAGLASLVVMQRQGLALGLGNGEVVEDFHGSGHSGVVTLPQFKCGFK
jgi:hypothetical protein